MVRFIKKIDLEHIDFSFIPSLRCNIKCSFCMYDCCPENNATLDIRQASHFLKTVDWQRIGSWGFYGGEVSIEIPLYQSFIDLIPAGVPMFTITNGSWTADPEAMNRFLQFSATNGLSIIVSGTEEHKKFQNKERIKWFDGVPGIHFKDDDDIHPMGRAQMIAWTCNHKCLTHPQPIRLAMFPGGHIILQNCDGVYPVIGNWFDDFNEIFGRAVKIREQGCRPGSLNVNDVLAKVDSELSFPRRRESRRKNG
jgi:hypothetical protein